MTKDTESIEVHFDFCTNRYSLFFLMLFLFLREWHGGTFYVSVKLALFRCNSPYCWCHVVKGNDGREFLPGKRALQQVVVRDTAVRDLFSGIPVWVISNDQNMNSDIISTNFKHCALGIGSQTMCLIFII